MLRPRVVAPGGRADSSRPPEAVSSPAFGSSIVVMERPPLSASTLCDESREGRATRVADDDASDRLLGFRGSAPASTTAFVFAHNDPSSRARACGDDAVIGPLRTVAALVDVLARDHVIVAAEAGTVRPRRGSSQSHRAHSKWKSTRAAVWRSEAVRGNANWMRLPAR